MGHQCCGKQKVKRGLWSPEEDEKLMNYITTHGHGSWSSVPKLAGLQRCGKSCRLRWINYLRPDLKRGAFTALEERIIIDVHRILGNRWAQIAKHLPGRTDNEVKNYWNSCIKKKLLAQGLDPKTHNLIPTPRPPLNGIAIPAAPSPLLASSLSSSTPFTITPAMKSFDTMISNSMVDDLNAHLMTLPEALPMPNFQQYQHSHHLMSFKNKEPQAAINIVNPSSSSTLDHTNISSSFHQPGFVDEVSMWASVLEPAAATEVNFSNALNEIQEEQPAAEGEDKGQSSLSKMDFNEVTTEKGVVDMEVASYSSAAFDLELESALLQPDGAFYHGNSIDQLQWDC